MSNEPSRPDDDAPTGAAGARPDVPPADARRIEASREAAASAEERELSSPTSTGLGSDSGVAEPGATPEPGAGARDQPVAGNEPVTPAGPTAVPGARPAPSADPVASSAAEPASDAPAAAEPTTGPATTGAAGAAAAGPASTGPATTGPATTGPATTGPATTGPATTGPATTGAGAGAASAGAASAGAAGAASTGAPGAGVPVSGFAAPGEQSGAVPAGGGSSGNGRKILIGVLVVLLIAVVVYGVYRLTSGSAKAEAGDCVSVSAETDDRADVETLDCSDAKAVYQVGKVLDATDATCPEEGLYTEFPPVGSIDDGDGDGYKLCLLPNLSEGACYKPDDGTTEFVKTDCVGPETFKVTKVVQGSTDLEACPDGAGMAYPEPAVTFCLAPAEM
ncbi:hypothetical protein [Saccharothrix sp. HUAS TT1]|uniref:LppU/SCO3897 family protein n=1 Tax=unclassified Saccharothrix TaxID=2593673 RepID=UPI00345B65BF